MSLKEPFVPSLANEAVRGSAPWRGDLLRAWASGGGKDALEAAAELLGFDRREAENREKDEQRDEHKKLPDSTAEQQAPEPTELAKQRPEPPSYWYPTAREYGEEHTDGSEDSGGQDLPTLRPEDLKLDPKAALPQPEPIVAWPRLWRALEDRIKTPIPRREIDVDELVRRWSRGELVRRLPRRSGLAHARLALFLDRSERLKPFWGDQVSVTQELARRLGQASLRFLPQSLPDLAPPHLASDERLLVMSDLGFYGTTEESNRWVRFGRRLRRGAGVALPVALIPCPRDRWRGDGPRLFSPVDWSVPDRSSERMAVARREEEGEEKESVADQVLRLASVARRLETGLVRHLRLLVPEADLGTEADLWSHPAVRAAQAIGLVLEEERAKAWRLELAEQPLSIQKKLVQLLALWHRGLYPETWAAEVSNLQAIGLSEEVIGDAAVAYAQEIIARIANTVTVGKGPYALDGEAWFHRHDDWTRREFWRQEGYRQSLARMMVALRRRDPQHRLPSGVTPEMLAGASTDLPLRRYAIWQEGDHFLVRTPREAGNGSRLAEIEARSPQLVSDDGHSSPVEVDLGEGESRFPATYQDSPHILVTDVEAIALEPLKRPSWARRAGRDRFGLWATLEVDGVIQRFRWIPPGRFWMGSPESEVGRLTWEGPRHPVILTEGFWLGETPCTQELWEVLMGKNPSRFPSPDRPVERVSWKDCQDFISSLNERTPALNATLPTEAQWEYACRAGTTGATWLGDLKIHGNYNAPALDEIGWYGGNSGEDFELAQGYDTSKWRDQQYPHDLAGSHPVGRKAANPWGLYDMLGNVHEWCSDFWRESYGESVEVNPHGPEEGSSRVIRGGSWFSYARYVRAAYRFHYGPGSRRFLLGFRLALGAGRGAQGKGSLAAKRGTSERQRSPQVLRPQLPWAKDSGEDDYGRWAVLEVSGIEQRLRWIPPGRFLMGSPETEEGRWDDEGPQHEVQLTQGYWLGDTPCTQDLWEAVTGKNPSRFQSGNRPVEQVSWDDCQTFLRKLGKGLPDQLMRLPTEAEWEYACRAGKETSTYAGELKILGERNGPLLDEIAWYGGNSGVDFELENGYDSSEWKEKQYPHKTAGTHPVGQKAPNRWGLYDMLGNVHEWCSDYWDDSYAEAMAVDPRGPEGGSFRVVRGGSWDSHARRVRAAYRDHGGPGYRDFGLGFRLALGPVRGAR